MRKLTLEKNLIQKMNMN